MKLYQIKNQHRDWNKTGKRSYQKLLAEGCNAYGFAGDKKQAEFSIKLGDYKYKLTITPEELRRIVDFLEKGTAGDWKGREFTE